MIRRDTASVSGGGVIIQGSPGATIITGTGSTKYAREEMAGYAQVVYAPTGGTYETLIRLVGEHLVKEYQLAFSDGQGVAREFIKAMSRDDWRNLCAKDNKGLSRDDAIQAGANALWDYCLTVTGGGDPSRGRPLTSA